MGALEDIFAQFGVEKPTEVSAEQERAMDDTPEAVRLEGEWLLYSLKYPLSPRLTKRCARCGEAFQTNYQGMAHCSNRCVVLELRERFGIDWKPANRRDKEKWLPVVPASVIPLAALRAMKKLVAQAEADLETPIEIGVPVEKFVLPLPALVGRREPVSESRYMLPEIQEKKPSLASEPPQEPVAEPGPSHNQEALVQEDIRKESDPAQLLGSLFGL